MVKYLAIKGNEKRVVWDEQKTYGICACLIVNGIIEIVRNTGGLSEDVNWIKALADKLNRNDVDPVHLNDIIEDELYYMRE